MSTTINRKQKNRVNDVAGDCDADDADGPCPPRGSCDDARGIFMLLHPSICPLSSSRAPPFLTVFIHKSRQLVTRASGLSLLDDNGWLCPVILLIGNGAHGSQSHFSFILSPSLAPIGVIPFGGYEVRTYTLKIASASKEG